MVYGGEPPLGNRLKVAPNPCWTRPRFEFAPNAIGVAVGPAIEKLTLNAMTVSPAPSVACMVTFEFPVSVGVPLTTPDAGSRTSPATIGVSVDQVYVLVPPRTSSGCTYGVL